MSLMHFIDKETPCVLNSILMSIGIQAHTYSIGSTKVTSNITLDNVLYMSKFKGNLLSMSQVTHTLECIVILF